MRNLKKSYLKTVFVFILLAALALAATGCADFGAFPAPEPPGEKPEETLHPTYINTEDRAILAVYEHLLDQAETHEAKTYLAEFSSASDNWSAESELYKDGTTIWYVVVDMTETAGWEGRPYWQQAGWLVYKDGRVIPSNRLEANALRIEADLQELSFRPEP